MATVSFWKGTRAAYNAIGTKDTNKIYFLEDEGRIFKGEASYTPEQSNIINADSTNGTIPGTLAVKTYVDSAVDNLSSGVGTRIVAPVQDISALKAVATASDKVMILVEDAASIFRYDAESTETADDVKVVAPSDETLTGKWIKMYTALNATAGNGIAVSGNQIALNADSGDFDFDAENNQLKIKPDGTTAAALKAYADEKVSSGLTWDDGSAA